MKLQERKYTLNMLSLTGYKHVHTIFSSMAAKGWMVEQIGVRRIRYKKIQPKNIVFSICSFQERGTFRPAPPSELSFFRQLCEESGWTFVTSSQLYHVFCSESRYITPLHTDSAVEFSYLTKKLTWPLIALHLVLLFYNYVTIQYFLGYSYHYLESMLPLTVMALGVLTLPLQLTMAAIQANWYLINQTRLKKEAPLFFYSVGVSTFLRFSYYICSLLFFGIFMTNIFYFSFLDKIHYLYLLSGSLIGFFIRKHLDKQKDSDTQLALFVFSILFSLLFLPFKLSSLPIPSSNSQHALALADIGITNAPLDFIDNTTLSPFLSDSLNYSEFNQTHRIQTMLLAFKHQVVFEYYLESFLLEYPNKEFFGEDWHSTKGYYLSAQKNKLVILDNLRLIQIGGSEDFSDPSIISSIKSKYNLP